MKKIYLTLLIIIVLIFSVSCTENIYSNSFNTYELYSRAIPRDINSNVSVLDKDVIYEISDSVPVNLTDYTVIRNKDAKNINEIGIFKFNDGRLYEFEAIVKKYVEDKQNMYRAMNYLPNEAEKIEFAKVKVFGNYLIYSFLDEENTNTFYSNIENLLKNESTAR